MVVRRAETVLLTRPSAQDHPALRSQQQRPPSLLRVRWAAVLFVGLLGVGIFDVTAKETATKEKKAKKEDAAKEKKAKKEDDAKEKKAKKEDDAKEKPAKDETKKSSKKPEDEAKEKLAKEEKCLANGFTSLLQCSGCGRLRDTLPKKAEGRDALLKECQECCHDEEKGAIEKAVLYYCPSQLDYNQDLEDFVKRKADGFKSLKLVKMIGARASLLMLRKGETEETSKDFVSIHGWKSNDIRDFLASKLKEKTEDDAA